MASTNYKTECKEYANGNRLGKIIVNGTTLEETNYISEIQIEDSCVTNGIINGSVVNRNMTFKTINYASEILGDSVNAQIGVRYSDNTTEYENLGNFVVTRETIDDTGTTATYETEDALTNLDKTYICGINNLATATIGDFWLDACSQVGLTPLQTTFTNSTIIVGGNPFNNGETIRTVLSQVASAGLYFIEIDQNTSKIALKWVDSTVSETFTKDDYSSLTKNQVYGPIDCLVIQDTYTEGENVTRGTGNKVFTINDNYFLYTEELRTQAIDAIWAKVQGFTYTDIEMTSLTGKPYLKKGNKISIQDMDGNYFNTYVLSHTFTYDGSFKSVIKAPTIEDEQEAIAIKNTQSATNKLRNVQRMVDKANGIIEDKITEIEEEVQTTRKVIGNPVIFTNGGEYEIANMVIDGLDEGETISGELKIRVTSKNVMNLIGLTRTSGNYIPIVDTNSILASGSNPPAYSSAQYNIDPLINVGETYTLSYKCSDTVHGAIYIDEYNGSTRTETNLTTFEVKEGRAYRLKVYLNRSNTAYSGDLTIEYTDIQLEYGSEITSFEENKKEEIPINLNGNEITQNDKLVITYGKVKLLKGGEEQEDIDLGVAEINSFNGYNHINLVATNGDKPNIEVTYFTNSELNIPVSLSQDNNNSIQRLQDNQSSYVTTATYDSDWLLKRDEILSTVSREYVSTGEFGTYKTTTSSEISQKADSIMIATTASEVVSSAISGIQDTINKVDETFTFDTNGLTIARGTSTMSLVLQNDRLSFKNGTDEVAYMSSNSFALTNLQTFKIGNFGFVIRDNGNVSFKKL